MTLVRRNHFLPTFNNAFDEFFGDIGKVWGVEQTKTVPAVNVSEYDSGFALEVAAPGLAKEDFKIALDGTTLTVSATKEANSEVEEKNYKRKEFYYTNFSRSFELPENIDVHSIEAKYENGILNVKLPLNKEVPQKVKEIEIS